MRAAKPFLLLAAALIIYQTGHAQETTSVLAPAPVAVPQNIIKLNLVALGAKNISLQYERALTPKVSLALGLGLMPSGHVPLSRTIRDYYLDAAVDKDENAVDNFVSDARLSGWSVTPEFRYYFGKRPQTGFYLAPYLRYSRYSLKWDYTFEDKVAERERPTDLTGTLTMFGGGLMAGAQWHFNKISLDWWILGLAYNSNALHLTARTNLSDKSAEDKQQLQEDIEGTTINGHHLNATVSNSGVSGRGNVGLPALRFGLCIGYRF